MFYINSGYFIYTVTYSQHNSGHRHAYWCGFTHTLSGIHSISRKGMSVPVFKWRNCLMIGGFSPRKSENVPSEKSLKQNELQGRVWQLQMTFHSLIHSHPFANTQHSDMDASLCLYDLWLLGASGPDGTQAEDEEDEKQ